MPDKETNIGYHSRIPQNLAGGSGSGGNYAFNKIYQYIITWNNVNIPAGSEVNLSNGDLHFYEVVNGRGWPDVTLDPNDLESFMNFENYFTNENANAYVTGWGSFYTDNDTFVTEGCVYNASSNNLIRQTIRASGFIFSYSTTED